MRGTSSSGRRSASPRVTTEATEEEEIETRLVVQTGIFGGISALVMPYMMMNTPEELRRSLFALALLWLPLCLHLIGVWLGYRREVVHRGTGKTGGE